MDGFGHPMRIKKQPFRLVVEGELSQVASGGFASLFSDVPPSEELVVDLEALEIEDAPAAVAAVNAVRELLRRSKVVVLQNAPQLLAHNLYRVGLLEGGRVRLVDMREDEAYG